MIIYAMLLKPFGHLGSFSVNVIHDSFFVQKMWETETVVLNKSSVWISAIIFQMSAVFYISGNIILRYT